MLIDRLGLPDALRPGARRAAELFPLFVTESFLRRMRPGDPRDPLLLQVLPLGAETDSPPGFSADPLGVEERRIRDTTALMTMVGGRIVHEEAGWSG